MRPPDKRNSLSATLALDALDAARTRISDAGGALSVWGILREDNYETRFGDGCYLHLRALALNSAAAERLADRARGENMTTWIVRAYRLELQDGLPSLANGWRQEEEFTINDFILILAEIGAGEEASRLMTGSGASGRTPGQHMISLK